MTTPLAEPLRVVVWNEFEHERENAAVRATAAWALGELEPKTAPRGLISALTDDDERVRMTAAWFPWTTAAASIPKSNLPSQASCGCSPSLLSTICISTWWPTVRASRSRLPRTRPKAN